MGAGVLIYEIGIIFILSNEDRYKGLYKPILTLFLVACEVSGNFKQEIKSVWSSIYLTHFMNLTFSLVTQQLT